MIYGGKFDDNGYVGGSIKYFDYVELKQLSIRELKNMAMELGFAGDLTFYHFVADKGYRRLDSVKDLWFIKFFIPESKEVEVCMVSEDLGNADPCKEHVGTTTGVSDKGKEKVVITCGDVQNGKGKEHDGDEQDRSNDRDCTDSFSEDSTYVDPFDDSAYEEDDIDYEDNVDSDIECDGVGENDKGKGKGKGRGKGRERERLLTKGRKNVVVLNLNLIL